MFHPMMYFAESTTTTTTTVVSLINAFWPLDNNTLEFYGTGFDGTPIGSPTYRTSLFGYGAAISLNQNFTQYVSISTMTVPFDSRSFTIEAWIYPISLKNTSSGIFGQCQASSTNLCLYFTIINVKLYCGFYNNDTAGLTTLTMNVWTHVACVYDMKSGMLEVWLDGVLDGSSLASPYLGTSGDTLIGAISYNSSVYSFNGYIDQVRYTTRAKSSAEILNDATLTVYYSFDGGSTIDNGPNGINASSNGSLGITTGRVNQALQFNSSSYLYFTYAPFYFLGISNHAFTMAMWAKPTEISAASTLVFIYNGWCIHFITIKSGGQLYANLWNGTHINTYGPNLTLGTWVHIGYTYSYRNGISLYINGCLYSTTGSFRFAASGVMMYMKIAGNWYNPTSCSPNYGGPFVGELDEFYLYSRELTASEICALANP